MHVVQCISPFFYDGAKKDLSKRMHVYNNNNMRILVRPLRNSKNYMPHLSMDLFLNLPSLVKLAFLHKFIILYPCQTDFAKSFEFVNVLGWDFSFIAITKIIKISQDVHCRLTLHCFVDIHNISSMYLSQCFPVYRLHLETKFNSCNQDDDNKSAIS